MPCYAVPPSALPGISPSRGEIGSGPVGGHSHLARMGGAYEPLISPLEGEMPGRAEGGVRS